MMPSRMGSQVRSGYNLKFDPGASTLGAPPPPKRPDDLPRKNKLSWRLPAVVGDLCCRALDGRHVYIDVLQTARRSWLSVV